MELALKDQPDLILLDIVMPKMDGLTMLKQYKDKVDDKTVPVILLTNLSDSEKVNEALGSGAYDYLVKSDWKLEDVVKKVKTRLAL